MFFTPYICSFLFFFFFCWYSSLTCVTHTHAAGEDTGGMVTYIIVKSICKASPCHRHCAPCSSTPCPTNLIPLTARGACGNLFGLSNAHFLLRVLALCVCVCVCVCWCVCISSLCAWVYLCLSPAQSIRRRLGNSCRIYALVRRLRFTRKLLLLLLLLLHLLLLVVLQPPPKIVRLRPRQLPLNFFFFLLIFYVLVGLYPPVGAKVCIWGGSAFLFVVFFVWKLL